MQFQILDYHPQITYFIAVILPIISIFIQFIIAANVLLFFVIQKIIINFTFENSRYFSSRDTVKLSIKFLWYKKMGRVGKL